MERILLTPRADRFDDPAWLFEPKYDGYRRTLYRRDEEVSQGVVRQATRSTFTAI